MTQSPIQSMGLVTRTPSNLFESDAPVHFEFRHEATYADPHRTEHLHVLTLRAGDGLFAIMTTQSMLPMLDNRPVDDYPALVRLARELNTLPVCLNAPLPLETVHVAKPWGQEIWYSGIEARGVCTTSGVSIAWLLDVFGDRLGCNQSPLLLKILDPFAEANLGDLYFEMHEKKIEVYVVTHVDRRAWPDGVGQIRYGFNQALMATYPDSRQFLNDYIESVRHYEKTRREIDGEIEKAKQQQDIPAAAPLVPAQYQALLADISPALLAEEEKRRDAMYRFTDMKPIRQGDVVTVRPLVPHSLQHGVRVIEFQTPHYERYILSFGQQVLTQDHWDTGRALDLAVTGDVQFETPEAIAPGRDLVADFSEFRVERIRLAPGERLTHDNARYSMVIGVTGETLLAQGGSEQTMMAECACLLPAGIPVEARNAGSEPAILLLAIPADAT